MRAQYVTTHADCPLRCDSAVRSLSALPRSALHASTAAADQIGKVKAQLAAIISAQPENVKLFPYLSEEQRIVLIAKQREANRVAFEEALRKKKAQRAAKAKAKKGPTTGKKKDEDEDDDALKVCGPRGASLLSLPSVSAPAHNPSSSRARCVLPPPSSRSWR